MGNFAFKGGISNGVYISKNGAIWRKLSGDFQIYSKLSIKTLLEFIIYNAYFQVGDMIFHVIRYT